MLDVIITQKKEEVARLKKRMPLSRLKERIAQRSAPLDFALALEGDSPRLIAEVKQASPSRGLLCPDFNPVRLAKEYTKGGAAAVSVLTESKYFMGSIDHLTAIKREVEIPLLRKDFIFDPYQVYESCAFGADAMLLIVASVSQELLEELLDLGHSLSMNCLVEAHSEDEVARALLAKAKIIGLNNRDLATFTVDINTTHRLRPLVPRDRMVVSESGIKNRSDIERLREWGINAALVGEALITSGNIQKKMRELII